MHGVIASSIVWGEVLKDIFADEVSGVDCVLETETQVYTYSIVNGEAKLKYVNKPLFWLSNGYDLLNTAVLELISLDFGFKSTLSCNRKKRGRGFT